MNRSVRAKKIKDNHYHYEQARRDSSTRKGSLWGLNASTEPFEPLHTCYREDPSIGPDLCRLLKRMQIPVFHGDKRTNQSWKAALLACIDNA